MVRLVNNFVRLVTRQGEHPRDLDRWREALEAAGLLDVSLRVLDHEAGVALARAPGRRAPRLSIGAARGRVYAQ